ASPSPNTPSRLGHADQPQQIGFHKLPRTFDAPAVGQHQRESRPSLRRLDRYFHQLRFVVVLAPPIIQRGDRNVVFGAVLPPRHAASCKTRDDAPDLLLASHPAILGSEAHRINVVSLDAYVFTVITYRSIAGFSRML